MTKCKFCEMYESVKYVDNRYMGEGFSRRYKAAFVSEKYRGKNLIGKVTHGSVELKYCPECGRKLDDKQMAS